MIIALLLAALLGPIDDNPKPKGKPAALVLDVRGKAEIRPVEGKPRPAEVGDLLYPDEVLAVPGDGQATVSILGLGAVEVIKPGTEARVGPKGCTPPGSVLARKEQPRSVASTMKNLKPSPGDGRKAGVVSRSGPEAPLAITPIYGANVTADRPGFAWPPAEKATTYRFRLLTGGGAEAWRAEVKEARLDFPADKGPLKAGYLYRWEVTDQDYRKVASGEFSVATESERAQLGELEASAASGDAADRFSAALAYRRLGAYTEAIAVLDRLVRESPDQPECRRMLDDLRRLAGRPEETKGPEPGKLDR